MRNYFRTKPVVVRAFIGCIVLIPLFAFGGLDDEWWRSLAWAGVYVAAVSLLFFLGVIDRSRGSGRRNSVDS